MRRMEGVRENARRLLATEPYSDAESAEASNLKRRLVRMVLETGDSQEPEYALKALLLNPAPWRP